MTNKKNPSRPTIIKLIQAIIAGAFGVQSSKQAQKDFESDSPIPYVIAGIIFTLLFILTLFLIVKIVIH